MRRTANGQSRQQPRRPRAREFPRGAARRPRPRDEARGHEIEQRATDAAAGRAYGNGHQDPAVERRTGQPRAPHSPPRHRSRDRIRRDGTQKALGATWIFRRADAGCARLWRRSPTSSVVSVAAAQWLPNASACRTVQLPRAARRHPPLACSRERIAARRKAQMAVARSVPPDEIPGPDRHRRVDDQQLAVCLVRAHAGDAALSARGDQRTSRGGVAIGAVRVEHQADGDPTLSRTDAAPTGMTARPRRSPRRCCGVRRAARASGRVPAASGPSAHVSTLTARCGALTRAR